MADRRCCCCQRLGRQEQHVVCVGDLVQRISFFANVVARLDKQTNVPGPLLPLSPKPSPMLSAPSSLASSGTSRASAALEWPTAEPVVRSNVRGWMLTGVACVPAAADTTDVRRFTSIRFWNSLMPVRGGVRRHYKHERQKTKTKKKSDSTKHSTTTRRRAVPLLCFTRRCSDMRERTCFLFPMFNVVDGHSGHAAVNTSVTESALRRTHKT